MNHHLLPHELRLTPEVFFSICNYSLTCGSTVLFEFIAFSYLLSLLFIFSILILCHCNLFVKNAL